jgi:preprotein translocase subunit YajC
VAQGGASSLIFIVVMIAIFYFMLIRPQKKRVQAHQQLISSVTEGDEIVTIGGIFGVVKSLGDDYVEVEVSPTTTMRFVISAIARKVNDDVYEEYEEDEEDTTE